MIAKGVMMGLYIMAVAISWGMRYHNTQIGVLLSNEK